MRVELIDSGCGFRRRRMAIRIEEYSLLNESTKATIDIREYPSARDWLQNFSQPESGVPLIVFLHSSSKERRWVDVVRRLDDIAEKNPSRLIKLITYTGSSAKAQSIDNGYLSTNTKPWWKHYPLVQSKWDFDFGDPQVLSVGKMPNNPPIERILSDTIGHSDTLNMSSIDVDEFFGDRKNEGLNLNSNSFSHDRHILVNSLGPLIARAKLLRGTQFKLSSFQANFKIELEKIQLREPEDPQVLIVLDEFYYQLSENVFSDFETALERLIYIYNQFVTSSLSIKETNEPIDLAAINSDELKVLWIEDDPSWYPVLLPLFETAGIKVDTLNSLRNVDDLFELVKDYDGIILDLVLDNFEPDLNRLYETHNVTKASMPLKAPEGIDILQILNSSLTTPPVCILSAIDSDWCVKACTHFGAMDYITKEHSNPENMIVKAVLAIKRHNTNSILLARPLNNEIITGDTTDPIFDCIKAINNHSEKKWNSPIVLVGQPGVGKSKIALEFHMRTDLKNMAFTSVDCSGLTREYFYELIHQHSSSNGTLYFKNFEKTPATMARHILKFLKELVSAKEQDSTPGKFPRCIFSTVIDPRNDTSGSLGSQAYRRQLLYPVYVPSLLDRVDFAISISQIFLTKLAKKRGLSDFLLQPRANQVLINLVTSSVFEGEGGNISGLFNYLREVSKKSYNGKISAKILKFKISDEFLQERKSSVNDNIIAAAVDVAQSITIDDRLNLTLERDRFEAYLVTQLIERYDRKETSKILNLSNANLRKRIQKYRDKSFIPKKKEK